MNFKLILKSLVIIAVLALLVIMGMNNRQTVTLSMPNILPRTQSQPAALMYFAFFGVGFLVGAILMTGGGGKKSGGSSGSKSKSQT
ncbi:MAG TPA: hypothetical protein VH619_12080 [Verrucomicrobiae bacterium]|jgi:uncharacterized membrane protein YciS (DUF1049 family)|nr:hypothetical protein [Verrucomicrobiae bacterium]